MEITKNETVVLKNNCFEKGSFIKTKKHKSLSLSFFVKDRIRSLTTVKKDPSLTTVTDDLSLMIVNNDPFLIDKIHFWSENIEEISLN